MNPRLKTFIEQYTELELGVKTLLLEQCRSLCAQCTICCCYTTICEEAFESAFLKLIHKQADQFDDSHGFLSETGCSLHQGRPPICYEFFCDDQLYFQPDELHSEMLRILGALPTHATQKALGDQPISEITQEKTLDGLNFQRLEKQLKESFQALEIIRTFYAEGDLSEESRDILNGIHITLP